MTFAKHYFALLSTHIQPPLDVVRHFTRCPFAIHRPPHRLVAVVGRHWTPRANSLMSLVPSVWRIEWPLRLHRSQWKEAAVATEIAAGCGRCRNIPPVNRAPDLPTPHRVSSVRLTVGKSVGRRKLSRHRRTICRVHADLLQLSVSGLGQLGLAQARCFTFIHANNIRVQAPELCVCACMLNEFFANIRFRR